MPRQGLTKEIIIAKSIEIIAQWGYSKLTFALLSHELDVKSPAMFRHFKGINDLKKAITLKAVSELTHSLQLALIGIAKEDAVRTLCTSYRKFATQNKGLYSAIQPQFFKEKEVGIAANGLLSVILSVLKGFNLVEKDYIHIVRLIRSSLHGFVIMENEYNFGTAANIEESFAYQIKSILLIIQSFQVH